MSIQTRYAQDIPAQEAAVAEGVAGADGKSGKAGKDLIEQKVQTIIADGTDIIIDLKKSRHWRIIIGAAGVGQITFANGFDGIIFRLVFSQEDSEFSISYTPTYSQIIHWVNGTPPDFSTDAIVSHEMVEFTQWGTPTTSPFFFDAWLMGQNIHEPFA